MGKNKKKFCYEGLRYSAFYNWVNDHMDELSDTEQKICLAVLMEVRAQNVYSRERYFGEKYAFRMEQDIVNAHGGRNGKGGGKSGKGAEPAV